MSRHPHNKHEVKLPPIRGFSFCGPWAFHLKRSGFDNCLSDHQGRLIVNNVPLDCGPLLAAGPSLLIALERIVRMTQPGSIVHEVALQAVENHRERDAMTLQEERIIPRPAPRLRIAGIAS